MRLQNTSDVYAKYKALRDRAEFGRWHKSIRTNAPPAKTPEEHADRYIKYILNPEIEEALPGIPEGERASALEKIDVWREQLRRAILDFEKIEVTPEKVVGELRQKNFNEALIQFFIDAVDRARQSGNANLNEVIIRTQQEISARREKMESGTRTPLDRLEPSSFNVDYGNRMWIYAHEKGKLTSGQLGEMQYPNPSTATLFEYLYGPGHDQI
jgi:hypothetical protein